MSMRCHLSSLNARGTCIQQRNIKPRNSSMQFGFWYVTHKCACESLELRAQTSDTHTHVHTHTVMHTHTHTPLHVTKKFMQSSSHSCLRSLLVYSQPSQTARSCLYALHNEGIVCVGVQHGGKLAARQLRQTWWMCVVFLFCYQPYTISTFVMNATCSVPIQCTGHIILSSHRLTD